MGCDNITYSLGDREIVAICRAIEADRGLGDRESARLVASFLALVAAEKARAAR